MKLVLYREMTMNSFRSLLAFRAEVLLFLLSQVFRIFIQIYIWHALFDGKDALNSQAGAISLHEMITYVLISSVISVFATNDVIFRVSSKVSSGEIAMDLIKPMSFRSVVFCQMLGSNLYRILFELVPLIVISILFFHVQLPSFAHGIAFLLLVLGGLFLNFVITYTIGLIAFWYILIWQVNMLLNGLIRLFSGAFIPIWFFSDSLIQISYFLPFRLIYYEPISVYLGKISSVEELLLLFAQQLAWIVGLLLLQKWMWTKAVKRLVLQGG
ncbi:ABC transporter permease [Paenibacillus sp. GCM10012307]|uniref:ABC-2 family transporter protein n=1 Tax=Paenibacillus roseus TaxID=2798579 RepID=A0A934J0L6_9BACL|nr:ABC-2 family transporter protein [Paenibacillus roseus]MBJ6362642.1 ABC-2 family transporter protein [Paenibacillus roseus]